MRVAHGLGDANQSGQLNRCWPKSGEAHSSGSCGGGSGSWALGAASIAGTASVGAARAWPFPLVAWPSSIGMVMFVPGNAGNPPSMRMVCSCSVEPALICLMASFVLGVDPVLGERAELKAGLNIKLAVRDKCSDLSKKLFGVGKVSKLGDLDLTF